MRSEGLRKLKFYTFALKFDGSSSDFRTDNIAIFDCGMGCRKPLNHFMLEERLSHFSLCCLHKRRAFRSNNSPGIGKEIGVKER